MNWIGKNYKNFVKKRQKKHYKMMMTSNKLFIINNLN